MTQEFHLSVTSIRNNEYLVRTEQVAPGVPLAEEQVIWPVDDWLTEASLLMDDPLLGWLRSGVAPSLENQAGTSFGQSLRQKQPPANLIEFGQRLYDSLFQGSIRDSWIMAQGIAQHQRARLRFRLGLKGTKLHRLPWEVLYAGDRPLASGTDVIFSRYHSSFSILKSQRAFQKSLTSDPSQPLRILMVLAAPSDQEVLALKQEADHLQAELQKVSQSNSSAHPEIELTILEQPGRAQLTQALEHNHYQVLHYAGHSNLGVSGGSLYLVNGKTGLTEILSGDDLAGLLVNNGIRMAVFNSCLGVYTATSNAGDREGNLAEALVRRGIPAVLAMAERIPDDVALNLSQLFYRNLKQSYPVDLSLSRTRQGLISSYTSNQLYWALPILYLHPEFDGCLQPFATDAAERSMVLDSSTTNDLYTTGDLYTPNDFYTISDPYVDSFKGNLLQPPLADLDVFSDPATDDLPDFDDVEFEDPELPEEERVADLVNTLSQSPTLLEQDEPLLAAYPPENLLEFVTNPATNPYLQSRHPLSSLSDPSSGSYATPILSPEAQGNMAIALDPPDGPVDSDVQMYAELKNVLAGMGKLTEDIEASHQIVQENPNSCEAYTDFGWALYQQGFLREAISAYHQAIRLNPTYADAYSRLALALYQQGKIDAGIQVYNLAVKLDPRLTDAPTSLRTLLEQNRPEVTLQGDAPPSGVTQSALPPADLAKPDQANSDLANPGLANSALAPDLANPDLAKSTASKSEHVAARQKQKFYLFRQRSRKTRLWIGLVLAGFSTMLATRIFDTQLMQAKEWLFHNPASKSLPSNAPGDPEALAKLAIPALELKIAEYLKQGQLANAQTAIAVLLDQGALESADTQLKSWPDQPANSETTYLKGRVLWQHWLAEPGKYSGLEARKLWETAAQEKPTPSNQSALGFAYYTEGQFKLAEDAWMRSLKLFGKPIESPTPSPANGQPTPAATPTAALPESLEILQVKAGLALVWLKKADRSAPNEQATLRQSALKLRKDVLEGNGANFQPESLGLGKNWMWSEIAIKDWRSLLATPPQ